MPYAVRMSKPTAVAVDLDEKTLAELDRLCAHLGRTREHLVMTAILRFVGEEIGAITEDEFADLPPYRSPDLDWEAIDKANASFHAFLQAGIDDLDAGRVVSHEELMRELRERYSGRQAAE